MLMKRGLAVFICFSLILSVSLISASILGDLFNKNKISGNVVLDKEGWTAWLNRDGPSGSGDWETLSSFVQAGQSCVNPSAIECRKVLDKELYSPGIGEKVTCDKSKGLICLNSDNPLGCSDYEVRFYCGTEIPFCESDPCGISVGKTKKILIDGITYEITLNGFNTDANTVASITINSVTKTLSQGQNKAYSIGNVNLILYAKTVLLTSEDGSGYVMVSLKKYPSCTMDSCIINVSATETVSINGKVYWVTLNGFSSASTTVASLTIDGVSKTFTQGQIKTYSIGGVNINVYAKTISRIGEGGEGYVEIIIDTKSSLNCGNGIQDVGEQCDGNKWAVSASCQYFGYVSGILSCNDNCTFNFNKCAPQNQTNQTCNTHSDCNVGCSGGLSPLDCGNACVNGECIKIECNFDTDCDVGQKCIDWRCIPQNQSCIDSDGGLNYYVNGVAEEKPQLFGPDNSFFSVLSNSTAILYLSDKNLSVVEGTIYTYRGMKFNVTLIEPRGYSDGSDKIDLESLSFRDQCLDKETLLEYQCQLGHVYLGLDGEEPEDILVLNKSSLLKYNLAKTCPNGCVYGACVQECSIDADCPVNYKCVDGACVQQGNQTNECSMQELEQKTCSYNGIDYKIKRSPQCNFLVSYQGVEEKFELPMLSVWKLKNGVSIKNKDPCDASAINLIFEGEVKPSCESGCALDSGKCVQIGYRQNGDYCSPNSEFVKQLADDKSCDNNFECSSNLCLNSKCVSGSLLQKILNWFKNLFG
jgi:hypothetical protein